MDSAEDVPVLAGTGSPIQKSPDQSLFSNSPKLIAASHVFHRLLMPRHPPFALNSLATKQLTQSILAWLIYFTNIQIVKEQHIDDVPYRFDANIRMKSLSFRIVCQNGGGERVRTDDLLRARQALSQLSYTPENLVVGLDGFEPSTSRLSGVRSNQTELQALGDYGLLERISD